MAYLVTEAEVYGIIEVDSDVDLDPFIRVAHLIVDEQLSGKGMSDDRLKEIERWLSAHFVAIRDMRIANETAGVSNAFQYNLGLNFQVTMYGQQAMMLDTSGTLAALNKAKGSGASYIECLNPTED